MLFYYVYIYNIGRRNLWCFLNPTILFHHSRFCYIGSCAVNDQCFSFAEGGKWGNFAEDWSKPKLIIALPNLWSRGLVIMFLSAMSSWLNLNPTIHGLIESGRQILCRWKEWIFLLLLIYYKECGSLLKYCFFNVHCYTKKQVNFWLLVSRKPVIYA